MNRQDIERMYTIRKDGRIADFGKFEAEQVYVPYYWNMALEGMFAEDVNGVYFMPLDAADHTMFPELDGAYGIGLEENDQGFVSGTLFMSQDGYNKSIERMEQEEAAELGEDAEEDEPELMWFSSSSGRIEIEMTLEQAQSGSHQGACDDDVAALAKVPEIKAQLDAIEPKLLAAELKEYGAWDAQELADHDQNIQRILWLACGDITDNAVIEQE